MHRSIAASRFIVSCTSLGAAGCFAAAALAQPAYHVELLPVFEGGANDARALNNAGVVTGGSGLGLIPGIDAYRFTADGLANLTDGLFDISHGQVINDQGYIAGVGAVAIGEGPMLGTPVLWTPDGEMIPLGGLGGLNGWMIDINENARVVGVWYDDDNISRGFLADADSGTVALPPLHRDPDGWMHGQPNAINDLDVVVGQAWDGANTRAARWIDFTPEDLGDLGGARSEAFDINNNGVVVGHALDAHGFWQAFRYDDASGMTAAKTPVGAVSSRAERITDSGFVAGQFRTDASFGEGVFRIDPDGAVHAISPDERFAGLILQDVNEAGAMVGLHHTDGYEFTAWVWTPAGDPLELNGDVLSEPIDWFIVNPVDINDAGQILVTGFQGSVPAAALLTPAPLGDLDVDLSVDAADLALLLAAWGPCAAPCLGDLNDDLTVDAADLALLLNAWTD